jgi:uncharacterized protein YukE
MLRMDPGLVRGAAADTEALSRQVARRLDHSLDGADAVHGAHQGNGWESPAHFTVCAGKWEDHMISLAKRMGDLSQRLKDSADSYDRADAEADARLRAGLNDLGQV